VEIAHILLSRFAVGSKRHHIDKEWVDYRLDLLEKYCYPSIAAQTCQNFEWYVFSTSSNLNDEQIERINKLDRMNHIIMEPGTGQNAVAKEIAESKQSKNKILITTRIDCDDAMRVDFMKRIQENVIKNDAPYVINFSTGLEYNLNRTLLTIRTHSAQTNMFTSMVETDTCKTVWCVPHHTLRLKFPVKQIDKGTPRWIQFIHKNNICTTKSLSPHKYSITPKDLMKQYGIKF
jgi:hypothetical protein